MRFQFFTLLIAFFLGFAVAVKNQKPILVTYPENTPQSVIDEAMNILKGAGGVITHEYTLIKGFAAKASESTVEALRTLGSEFVPLIEDDVVVRINS